MPQSEGSVFKGAEEGGPLPACKSASLASSPYKTRHHIAAGKSDVPVKYKGYLPWPN